MSDSKGLLKSTYSIETKEETQNFHQDWAAGCDAETTQIGFTTTQRCAAALARFAPDRTAPVLDVGCGTGLSGIALRRAGFSIIDGCDLDIEKLNHAKKRKGLYRRLWGADAADPLAFSHIRYANIAAMDVIAPNHAPPGTIDQILNALPKNGLFVLSLNGDRLKDPEFKARIAENVDTGMARLLFKEQDPHLSEVDTGSTVYILQRV